MDFPRKGKPKMKKLLLAMSALAALSLLAPSDGVAQSWTGPENLTNAIGIYTTATPTPASANDDAVYSGAPGQFTAYVVCTNPWNDNTNTAISIIGGFEFKLVLPGNVFLLNAALPPQSTNFATPPEFLCGANAPVNNSISTLITLTLGWFDGVPGTISVTPVEIAPASVPGNIAVTDYNDDFSISVAKPSSGVGAFDQPVFGMGTPVVPNDDTTWGGVKSLYR